MSRPMRILQVVISIPCLLIVCAALLLAAEGRGKLWHEGKTVSCWANAKKVEIHIDKPDGDLLATLGPVRESTQVWGSGRVDESWCHAGVRFYLQDVSDGKPLTKENTLDMMIF